MADSMLGPASADVAVLTTTHVSQFENHDPAVRS
jgi:hypothetical protein